MQSAVLFFFVVVIYTNVFLFYFFSVPGCFRMAHLSYTSYTFAKINTLIPLSRFTDVHYESLKKAL